MNAIERTRVHAPESAGTDSGASTALTGVDLGTRRILVPHGPAWAGAVDALGDADRAQLDHMSGPARRARFVTGRVELRRLAVARFGVPAGEVRIHAQRPALGRPYAHRVSTRDGRSLSASISHAGERVLVAVGATLGLGVDLVEIDAAEFPGFDGAVLTTTERVATSTCLRDRSPWRARVWAAKEAALKATRHGRAAGPAGVRLDAPQDGLRRLEDRAVVATVEAPDGAWTVDVHPTHAPEGYVAAVAVMR